jgi:hypothetical protein
MHYALHHDLIFFNSKKRFHLRYVGFWITVRNDELALGKIGDPLVQPLITWNDTLRTGPRDPFYFGLTTDKVQMQKM